MHSALIVVPISAQLEYQQKLEKFRRETEAKEKRKMLRAQQQQQQ